MNRNQIIEHLTKVKYIRNTCKIAEGLSDDLFQHIWVMILELDHERLETIYNKGYLQFYIYRMIVNEHKNPNNKFLKQLGRECKLDYVLDGQKKMHNRGEDFRYSGGAIENISFEDGEYNKDADCEFERSVKQINNELDKMYFYDREVFKLYLEHKSVRKVEAKTGIKYGAVHQTVTKVKKRIIESFNSRPEK